MNQDSTTMKNSASSLGQLPEVGLRLPSSENPNGKPLESLSSTRPPKMLSNAELAKRLDEKPNLEQMKQNLSTKEDLQKVTDQIETVKSTQDLIQDRMMDQNRDIFQAVKDAHDIGFSSGLGKQVSLMSQRVSSIQNRVDSHNVHMDEIVRQNESMNADFQDAGARLAINTKAINENLVPTMNKLLAALSHGVYHNALPISRDVYRTLEQSTGLSVHDLMQDMIVKELQKSRIKASKSAQYAKLYSDTAKATNSDLQVKIQQLMLKLNEIERLGWLWLSECFIMIIVLLVTPGIWKLLSGPVILLLITVTNHFKHKKEGTENWAIE